MTNFEYITANLGRFGIQPSQINAILYDNGLSAEGSDDPRVLKLAMHKSALLLINGLTGVSESGISFQWDKDGFLKWYSLLSKELGVEDSLAKSVITDKSNIW